MNYRNSRRRVPDSKGGMLLTLPSDKQGGDCMVTYEALFAFTSVIVDVVGVCVATVGLIIAIHNKKK